MSRLPSTQPTEAEHRILSVLRTRGKATVSDVVNALEDSHGLAHTTVLTTMRIAERKS